MAAAVASLLGGTRRRATPAPRNDAPVPLVSRSAGYAFGGGLYDRRDAVGQIDQMANNGTVFGIVNRTSTAVAETEWKLYRKAKSGKEEDRVQVTSHALLDLLNKPNAFFSRMLLFESAQQHLDLTGESFLLVTRAGRIPLPLELWPIRPDRMTPVPHPTKYLAGWVYTSPDGERVPLEVDEVIQTRTPNPKDIYRGLGPVQTVLMDTLGAGYAAEWNANFFRNSAEPGGIIEVPESLTDDDFNQLRDRWNEQHKGVARAHRVAILEQAKWVDRKYTQRDMEFSALRGVSRDAIMEAFGFPRGMLGITDDVNRAQGESGERIFARWLTVPRLNRWRDALNTRLLPMYGDTTRDLEVDCDSPVPADEAAENAERTSKADAAQKLIAAGFDGESVAKAYELPDGLVWEKPADPSPPPPVAPGPAGPTPAEPGAPQPPAAPEPPGDAVAALFRGITRNNTPTVLNEAGWPTVDEDAVNAVDLRPVQAAWEAALAALLETWQASVVADWIRQLIDGIRSVLRGDGGTLADLRVDSTTAAGHLTTAMRQLAQTAAQHAVDEAAHQDVTLQPAWPSAGDLEAAAREIAAFEGQRHALTAGREAARVRAPGVPDDEVVDHVRGQLEQLAPSTSEQALGGALTGAQNRARADTFRGGPVGALYATEAMDSNTCKPCRAIHGRFICTTDDLAALWKLYPTAGYIDCLGRWRCRGTWTGVWRPKTTEGGQ